MLEKLKKDIYTFRYAIITVVAYLIFMKLVFSELCPIKAIFKVNCPGCGLTRAAFNLCTGNIQKAIELNYSIFFWILLIILFFIDRYIHKLNKYVLPIALTITALVTIVRYILLFIK